MFIWLIVIVLSVVLDQVSKYLTVLYLKPVDTVPIIQDVLHLTYVENRGAAFGMMKDSRWFFMTVSTLAIVAFSIYLFRKKPASRLECLALSFVIGGGIGNMIDRTFLGYVVDMIDFRLIHFAVFNVADSFVCVGAGLLMIYLIGEMIRESREGKKQAAGADGQAETEPETETEIETEPTAEAETESETESKAETEATAEAEMEPEPKAETGIAPEPGEERAFPEKDSDDRPETDKPHAPSGGHP